MNTIRNITFLLLCGLGIFAADAFGQDENCDKGERGDRAAMKGGGEAGARGGGAAQRQGTSGQGLSPQQTAQRMLSNFDADGDGALNMQELSNGLEALQRSMRQQRGQSNDQSQRGQGGRGQQQAGNDGQRQRQGRSGAQAGQGNSARGGRGGSQRRGR